MLIRDLHFGEHLAIGRVSVLVTGKEVGTARLEIDGEPVPMRYGEEMQLVDPGTGKQATLVALHKSGRIVRLGITAPRDVKIVQAARP